MERILVPYKQIVADEEFNARKIYEGIEELAAQIKADGLLNPLIVRKAIDAKTGEENGKFSVAVGFRRHRAIGHLAAHDGEARSTQKLLEGVPVQVFEGDDKEAYFVNLAENEARASLKPWELAERCKFLKDTYKMSGTDIGNRLGKTKGYVNNLIYIVERLDPRIYDVFKGGHLSVIPAQAIASIEDKDEQWETFMRDYAKVPPDEMAGPPPEGPQLRKPRRSKMRRPGEKRLLEALEAARRTSHKPSGAGWKQGLVLGLAFARGETKVLPGVFPKKERAKKTSKRRK